MNISMEAILTFINMLMGLVRQIVGITGGDANF